MAIPVAALAALPWSKIGRVVVLVIAVVGTAGAVWAGYAFVSGQADARVDAEVRASRWASEVRRLRAENAGYAEALEGYKADAAAAEADRDAWVARYEELRDAPPEVVERRTEVIERIPETIVSAECSEAAVETLGVLRRLAAP